MVFAQLLVTLRGIDELHLATALSRLLVGENPHVGSDTCIIEDIVRQLHDAIYQVVFYQVSADVTLTTTRIACKERRTIVNGSDTTALWLHIEWFHLVDFL